MDFDFRDFLPNSIRDLDIQDFDIRNFDIQDFDIRDIDFGTLAVNEVPGLP